VFVVDQSTTPNIRIGMSIHGWACIEDLLTEPEPQRYTLAELRDPATIVQVLDDLGWHKVADDHQPDCPAMVDPVGLRCQCVPPAVTWSAPNEVLSHLGEDWDSRKNRRTKR
jgi:hypothetical protein